MKRRTWILTGLTAAGALVVGWSAMPARSRLGSPELLKLEKGEIALNGWLKIAADGAVILAMPRSEMGQGVHSALRQIVAEELDVSMDQVRIEQAGGDKIYGNVAMFVASLPFHPAQQGSTLVKTSEWMVGKIARELGVIVTGGSSSVADAWGSLRLAAAAARAQLLAAAAQKFSLSPDALQSLKIENGLIQTAGKSASFAQLAPLVARAQPKNIQTKAAKDYKLIGKAQPRGDALHKVTGQAQFGIDVRVPGMVYAAVKLSPMIGGSAGRVDSKDCMAFKGVERLVALPADAGGSSGFAVVASSTWAAMRGAALLDVEWQARPLGALNTQEIEAQLESKAIAGGGFTFHERGDAAKAEQQAARKIEAVYSAPYLAHATMEPMNCTAQFKDGQLEIWAPTQVPDLARAAAARVAGVGIEKVKINVTLLGGGFGRRLEADFICQAVRVALETGGRAVQLVYSREEDTTHDFYRPAGAALLRASIDANGLVSSLRVQSAGDAITPRWMERVLPALAGPIDTPDKTTAEGLFDLPYDFAHQHMSHKATKMGVPVGFWRSVGHSHNAFFSESFIDELAHATQTDPVQFRLRHLSETHAKKHRETLLFAAEKAKWGSKLMPGRAWGVALHESFGAVVAQIAEVSMLEGEPLVHRVVCAVHCGQVINPNVIEQQMQGSVMFALSAALWGRVDIEQGAVQQQNFHQVRIQGMKNAPEVQVHIVPSADAPSGIGEPGVPPLAAALANAMFAITGRRIRKLPLIDINSRKNA